MGDSKTLIFSCRRKPIQSVSVCSEDSKSSEKLKESATSTAQVLCDHS